MLEIIKKSDDMPTTRVIWIRRGQTLKELDLVESSLGVVGI